MSRTVKRGRKTRARGVTVKRDPGLREQPRPRRVTSRWKEETDRLKGTTMFCRSGRGERPSPRTRRSQRETLGDTGHGGSRVVGRNFSTQTQPELCSTR